VSGPSRFVFEMLFAGVEEFLTEFAQTYSATSEAEFLPPAPHSIVHRSKKIAEQTNNKSSTAPARINLISAQHTIK